MVKGTSPQPPDDSLLFIATILGCSLEEAMTAPVTFQVFDDVASRRDPSMARTLQGSLDELRGELIRRNSEGAGVFLCINETDGAGRRKANIRAARAWWADLDGHGVPELEALRLPLPPTFHVKSGHGLHLYWCAENRIPFPSGGSELAHHEVELRAIQKRLALFGADPSVCEVARVMRVPGFLNRKQGAGVPVTFEMLGGARYQPEEIRNAFSVKELSVPKVVTTQSQESTAGTAQALRRARAYAERLAREAPAVSGESGHRSTLSAAIKIACGFDLGADEAFAILRDVYNPACRPPWPEDQLRRKVEEALKVTKDRGWLLRPGHGGVKEDTVTYQADVRDVIEPASGKVIHEHTTRPCFPPFRLDQDGLWYLSKGKGDEDGTDNPVRPMKLCGPFEVLAETRDARASSWGLRLRWEDRDGKAHEETIPRELALGEGAEMARILVRRGLWVAPDEAKRKKLVSYLASVNVSARARSVEKVGWHGSSFVLPGQSFGQEASEERIFLALELEHVFRESGSLEEWQREVGRHAEGNSRLAFAISCAFAAPLLNPLGMESGGFQFFGQSSKGKTTCAEVAGSVWGGPVYRETWRATANGLEAIALAHNDCLLILDEQGQALPREAGEIAYLLANGMDKARARKTLDGRPRRRWQVLFLSTGEVTLSDKMREDGKAPKAGQDVRMVDIPVIPEGATQALERWEGFESSKALADHLKSACRKVYGAPARAFLERLCRLQTEELLAIEQKKVEWARRNTPAMADPQVGRVVDRFALVAIAGGLAQAWGIVPWSEGNADRAALACMKSWITSRGGLASGEYQRAIAAILGFIQRHGTSRFVDWDNAHQRVIECAGYRKSDGADRMDYLFNAEGWKDACDGLNHRDVSKVCAEAGLLEVVKESGRVRLQKNVKVPGRGTERFYIVSGAGLEAFMTKQAGDEGELAS